MENNTLIFDAKSVLKQLIEAIEDLTYDDFTKPLPLLSNSTIGEHTRHIIELFQCLMEGYDKGLVNYDDRKRDVIVQTQIDFAIESIAEIISKLERANKPLTLALLNDECAIDTNYNRELLYNIELCIHHQAILKIGLEVLQVEGIQPNLGVASSTLKYRNNVHSNLLQNQR